MCVGADGFFLADADTVNRLTPCGSQNGLEIPGGR